MSLASSRSSRSKTIQAASLMINIRDMAPEIALYASRVAA
jgi:hypothetical protein